MEAVIDKDQASALLASSVHADPFMISTEVEEVAINFNKPDIQWLDSLAVAQGRPERAVRLFARADSMRRTIGDPRPAYEQADVDRDLAAIRLQLGEAAGRAMTPEEAVTFALER